jgi:peptidoglycan DL-endopeptidase LytF
MSRRDTIIIAVLLNAGLLIVLFATSLKSDKVEEQPAAVTVLASNKPEERENLPMAASVTAQAVAPASSTDQVDQVIQQYVTPQVVASSDANPNFLADLQAIGTPLASAPIPEPTVEIASLGSNFKEVKVKKGDVLERIARQNHVTVSDVMRTNKLTSTRLKIGQVLKIPTKGSSAATAPTVASTDAQYYTIKAGDNPWTIAVKHSMKVEELLKLNDLDEQKARRLKTGDRIRIK